MKIRTRLVILIAAVMAPIVILAAIDTLVLWRVQRLAHEQTYLERVSALRLALDTELAATIRTLRWLSDSADLDTPERLPVLAARLERLLASTPAWSAITLQGNDGATLVRAGQLGPAQLDPGVVAELLRTRAPVVSQLVVLPGGGYVTYIAVPVLRADRVASILSITV